MQQNWWWNLVAAVERELTRQPPPPIASLTTTTTSTASSIQDQPDELPRNWKSLDGREALWMNLFLFHFLPDSAATTSNINVNYNNNNEVASHASSAVPVGKQLAWSSRHPVWLDDLLFFVPFSPRRTASLNPAAILTHASSESPPDSNNIVVKRRPPPRMDGQSPTLALLPELDMIVDWRETLFLNCLSHTRFHLTVSVCRKCVALDGVSGLPVPGRRSMIPIQSMTRPVFASPNRIRMDAKDDVKGSTNEWSWPQVYFFVNDFDDEFFDHIIIHDHNNEFLTVELTCVVGDPPPERSLDTPVVEGDPPSAFMSEASPTILEEGEGTIILFQGAVSYESLQQVYLQKTQTQPGPSALLRHLFSGTQPVSARLSSLFNGTLHADKIPTRQEFIMMRGPGGKGHSQVAISAACRPEFLSRRGTSTATAPSSALPSASASITASGSPGQPARDAPTALGTPHPSSVPPPASTSTGSLGSSSPAMAANPVPSSKGNQVLFALLRHGSSTDSPQLGARVSRPVDKQSSVMLSRSVASMETTTTAESSLPDLSTPPQTASSVSLPLQAVRGLASITSGLRSRLSIALGPSTVSAATGTSTSDATTTAEDDETAPMEWGLKCRMTFVYLPWHLIVQDFMDRLGAERDRATYTRPLTSHFSTPASPQP